jgi:hypothetical protein
VFPPISKLLEFVEPLVPEVVIFEDGETPFIYILGV